MAHYRVLSAIASGEDRASRVAERLELGRPAISAAVDALCRAGYLVRGEVKKDLRAFDLQLTDAGSALLQRVEAEMVRLFDDLCQQTPDGDRLREDLASLGVALDQVAERRLAERRRTGS
jgi:DNA-binding MarR family transcriptional regulator